MPGRPTAEAAAAARVYPRLNGEGASGSSALRVDAELWLMPSVMLSTFW
jgi:hypothetical protein